MELINKPFIKKGLFTKSVSGADRTRTGVQTNSPQAFYMFIYVLIVGKRQEHNKPTFSLEE